MIIVIVIIDCVILDIVCMVYSGDFYGGKMFEVMFIVEMIYFFIVDGFYFLDVGGYVFIFIVGIICIFVCTDKDCGDDGCGSVCGICADS